MHKRDWLLLGDRDGWNVHLIGKVGESSGLAQVYGMIGGELRFGYNTFHGNMDDTVIVQAVRRNKPYSFYGILSGEFRMYAWNIFLDGNYHRESLSVESKWDVWEGRVGFGFDIYGLDGRALWTWRSKEYETQERITQYASFQIGWTF